MGKKPCSAAKARKAATSSKSRALALPPRGLRVKNWKVLAPIFTASRPMARNPLALERWHPIFSIFFSPLQLAP